MNDNKNNIWGSLDMISAFEAFFSFASRVINRLIVDVLSVDSNRLSAPSVLRFLCPAPPKRYQTLLIIHREGEIIDDFSRIIRKILLLGLNMGERDFLRAKFTYFLCEFVFRSI